MATRAEKLIEANRRGLLTGEKKSKFDLAVSRGLITLPASQATDAQLSATSVPQGSVSRDQLLRMQQTLSAPAEETALGSFFAGARRGAENIGEGILQRGSEIAELFGKDTGQFQRDIALSGDIQQQKLKQTSAQRPITTGAGEIAGSIAALPLAPARVGQAVAAGAAFGAAQPTEKPSDIALNIAQDAALGGLGAAAVPFLQRGFNKAQALFSGIFKKVTGADPRPNMFTPEGALSEQGRSAIEQIGISQDEFTRIFNTLDENLEPIAATRLARAEEQKIPLTTAQATQDFGQQEAEQTLRSSISREGGTARQVESAQQQAIGRAQEGFEQGFGELADRETRGGVVQGALRDLQETGRRDIRSLYTAARETEGLAAPLNNNSLLDAIDDNLELPVDDKVVNSIETLMAKFGLIDGEVEQAGRFFNVTDSTGKKVKFRGEQTPLTLDNAEDFRQGLNRLFQSDPSGAVSGIVRSLDSLVDEAVTALPAGSERTAAFQAARGAAREQKQLFEAKDIIQNIVGFKKGTRTDAIQPDRVIDSIIKGANAAGNLGRVKSVLTGSGATDKTKAAWKSVQAQGAADIFAKSMNPATGDISGQRLLTAIKQFGGGSSKEGRRRLKILLGESFAQFDNMVGAIGDATIPVKGTTNPSGTAYKVINFMTRIGSVGSFGADAIVPLLNKVKDSANSKKVLQQIETAQPEKVQQAVRANNELIDSFLRLGVTGTLRDQARQ